MLCVVGENVLRVIVSFLGREDTLAVSSTSRALRAIVKRASSKIRVRVTDLDEIETCLRAWPSVTRLVVSRPSPSFVWRGFSTIRDLVLEDAVVPPSVVFESVRTLSLVRCSVATLDAPELVSLTIAAPTGGEIPGGSFPETVRSVHCSDVPLDILGPISRLPRLETLSLTRPFPSASVTSPFALIGSIGTLKSLTLCHFDAMNVYLEHTRPEDIQIRLETLRIDFCLVCADDPLLAYSHHCRRSNHECSEYTRRVEIAKSAPVHATWSPKDAISSYETYVHDRLTCPLINHQHGLRLLFAASLVEFERTHAATVRNAKRLMVS